MRLVTAKLNSVAFRFFITKKNMITRLLPINNNQKYIFANLSQNMTNVILLTKYPEKITDKILPK